MHTHMNSRTHACTIACAHVHAHAHARLQFIPRIDMPNVGMAAAKGAAAKTMEITIKAMYKPHHNDDIDNRVPPSVPVVYVYIAGDPYQTCPNTGLVGIVYDETGCGQHVSNVVTYSVEHRPRAFMHGIVSGAHTAPHRYAL